MTPSRGFSLAVLAVFGIIAFGVGVRAFKAPPMGVDVGDVARAREAYDAIGLRVGELTDRDPCWVSMDDLRGNGKDGIWIDEGAICFDGPYNRSAGLRPVRVYWEGDDFLAILPGAFPVSDAPRGAGAPGWAKVRAIRAMSERDVERKDDHGGR